MTAQEFNMRPILFLRKLILVQFAVTAGLVSFAVAQQRGTNPPPSPIETRQSINNDTFRELLRVARETPNTSVANSDASRAAQLKQLGEDFTTIQNINNRMMAEVWAREKLDYGHLADVISELNGRATRLKNNLSLPEPNSPTKQVEHLSISGLKEFRSALLLMDHSLMSFVTNPIFQRPDVIKIDLAKQARLDLENVIALSGNLKKITAKLQNSANSNH
jgi:hypothetical protein